PGRSTRRRGSRVEPSKPRRRCPPPESGSSEPEWHGETCTTETARSQPRANALVDLRRPPATGIPLTSVTYGGAPSPPSRRLVGRGEGSLPRRSCADGLTPGAPWGSTRPRAVTRLGGVRTRRDHPCGWA